MADLPDIQISDLDPVPFATASDLLHIEASGADYKMTLAQALGVLSFDDTPTQGSSKPVTSGGIYTALAGKANTSDVTTALEGKQDTLTFDNAPTENSTHPVTSGGVFDTLAELGTVIKKSDTVPIPAMDNAILASVVTVPKGKWIAIGQTEYSFDNANAYLSLTMVLTNQVEAINFLERGIAFAGGGLNGTGYIESDGTTTVQLRGYAYGNYSGSQNFTLALIKIGY